MDLVFCLWNIFAVWSKQVVNQSSGYEWLHHLMCSTSAKCNTFLKNSFPGLKTRLALCNLVQSLTYTSVNLLIVTIHFLDVFFAQNIVFLKLQSKRWHQLLSNRQLSAVWCICNVKTSSYQPGWWPKKTVWLYVGLSWKCKHSAPRSDVHVFSSVFLVTARPLCLKYGLHRFSAL